MSVPNLIGAERKKNARKRNVRLRHGHQSLHSLPRHKVIHQISTHLRCCVKEPKEFSIVALRDSLTNGDRVNDGRILQLFGREIGQRRIEFCQEVDQMYQLRITGKQAA